MTLPSSSSPVSSLQFRVWRDGDQELLLAKVLSFGMRAHLAPEGNCRAKKEEELISTLCPDEWMTKKKAIADTETSGNCALLTPHHMQSQGRPAAIYMEMAYLLIFEL